MRICWRTRRFCKNCCDVKLGDCKNGSPEEVWRLFIEPTVTAGISLVCQQCCKDLSFGEDPPEDLGDKGMRNTKFMVLAHKVKLYRYCKECGGRLIEKNRTKK